MKLNKRGIALILVYIVGVIMALLASALYWRSISETSLNKRFYYSTHAFWLAEAGIQRALSELNDGDGVWPGWVDGLNSKTLQVTWGDTGDFEVTVDNPQGQNPKITSSGFFPDRNSPEHIKRTIEATAAKKSLVFNYAAFGSNSVILRGQAQTDSYDSDQGAYNQNGNIGESGDVGTNGDITLSGQAYIGGDASTGSEGDFNEEEHVAGTISHENAIDLAPATVPPEVLNLPNAGSLTTTQTLNPGNYKYSAIGLSGQNILTVIGPAGIYLTGTSSLSISGQAKIVVSQQSTGPVIIYADGGIMLSGQGIVNSTDSASNLIVYGTSSEPQTVSISGQADLYGLFYAPNADISISGQGDLFGAFIGRNVTLSGQAQIHYDEALGRLDLGFGKYAIQSWKEI